MHHFIVNEKRCQVLIDGDSIICRPAALVEGDDNTNINISRQQDERRIRFAQIIGFKASQKKCKVYYASGKLNKFSGRLLKLKKLTIKFQSANHHNEENQHIRVDLDEQVGSLILLVQRIEDILEEKRKLRPKKILIYVNPFGGKGRALHIYKTQVRRLFDLANIEVKLIVTKYANHARDTIEDPQFNVEYFDGIICVGGDGMFSELMNGLLFRYNREKILLAQHCSSGNINDADGDEQFKTNNHDHNDKQKSDDHDARSSGANGNHDDDGSGGDNDDDRDCDECGKARMTIENEMTTLTATIQTIRDSAQTTPIQTKLTNRSADNDGSHDVSNNSEKTPSFKSGSTVKQTKLPTTNQPQTTTTDKIQLNKLRHALGGIGKQFVSPPVPVGVIGAGSTDANSFGLIGTNDVITATLNIILGNQINIDICSIHTIKEDKPLKFVSTFVAYGYFGDVIRESEKLRWLGPSRYDVTGFNNVIKNRTYNGLVRILTSPNDGTPSESTRCSRNCDLCCFERQQKEIVSSKAGSNHSLSRPKERVDEFRVVEREGSFVGVNAAVTACRCPQTKKGFSPNNHLANGCADLILVLPCSRLQYVQYLLRTGFSKKSAFDLKFVEAYRCRQFEFIAKKRLQGTSVASGGAHSTKPEASEAPLKEQPWSSSSLDSAVVSAASSTSSQTNVNNQDFKTSATNSTSSTLENKERLTDQEDSLASSWNADGEILKEQSIRVKVNNQLLRVFGTGEP